MTDVALSQPLIALIARLIGAVARSATTNVLEVADTDRSEAITELETDDSGGRPGPASQEAPLWAPLDRNGGADLRAGDVVGDQLQPVFVPQSRHV